MPELEIGVMAAPPAAIWSAIAASGGGDLVVVIAVAFLWRNLTPRLYQREAVNAGAAGDRAWVVADAVCVIVGAVVVGVVVARGAGVPRIVVVASAMR